MTKNRLAHIHLSFFTGRSLIGNRKTSTLIGDEMIPVFFPLIFSSHYFLMHVRSCQFDQNLFFKSWKLKGNHGSSNLDKAQNPIKNLLVSKTHNQKKQITAI